MSARVQTVKAFSVGLKLPFAVPSESKDSGHIEVTAEKSKSKLADRFIAMQTNLREWLLPLRKLKGNVTPAGEAFRQAFDQARVAGGITIWPDNALRHSFASYHLAHFKDAKALALEIGHADSGMLFNHYRALVKPKEAERYWIIRPPTVSKIVPMHETEEKRRLRAAHIVSSEPNTPEARARIARTGNVNKC